MKLSKRHIAKTITCRAIGSLDTLLLSWFISGDLSIGIQIGIAEVVTKMLLYYCHEKLWYRINFGLDKKNCLNNFDIKNICW